MKLTKLLRNAAIAGGVGVLIAHTLKKNPMTLVTGSVVSGMFSPSNKSFLEGTLLGLVHSSLAWTGETFRITGTAGRDAINFCGGLVGLLGSDGSIKPVRVAQMALFIGALEGTNKMNQLLLEGRAETESIVHGVLAGSFAAVNALGCGALANKVYRYLFENPNT